MPNETMAESHQISNLSIGPTASSTRTSATGSTRTPRGT
jgi:hypothetical protein